MVLIGEYAGLRGWRTFLPDLADVEPDEVLARIFQHERKVAPREQMTWRDAIAQAAATLPAGPFGVVRERWVGEEWMIGDVEWLEGRIE